MFYRGLFSRLINQAHTVPLFLKPVSSFRWLGTKGFITSALSYLRVNIVDLSIDSCGHREHECVFPAVDLSLLALTDTTTSGFFYSLSENQAAA